MADAQEVSEMNYEELTREHARIDRVIHSAIEPTAERVMIPRDAHTYMGRRAEVREQMESYEVGVREGLGLSRQMEPEVRQPARYEQGYAAAQSQSVTAIEYKGAFADNSSAINATLTPTLDEDVRASAAKRQVASILEYDTRSPQEQQRLDAALEARATHFKNEGIAEPSMALIAAAIEIRAAESIAREIQPAIDSMHRNALHNLERIHEYPKEQQTAATNFYGGQAASYNELHRELHASSLNLTMPNVINVSQTLEQGREQAMERAVSASMSA
jgi:hypothetical protein